MLTIQRSYEGDGITLIVVPPNAVMQWIETIQRQGGEPYSIKHKSTCKVPKGIKIVIVSSSLLNSNVMSKGLQLILSMYFKRFIVDEGHILKSSSTLTFKTAGRIKSTHVWVVTGVLRSFYRIISV